MVIAVSAGTTDEAGEVEPETTSVVGSIGAAVADVTGLGWLEVVKGPLDPAVVAAG